MDRYLEALPGYGSLPTFANPPLLAQTLQTASRATGRIDWPAKCRFPNGGEPDAHGGLSSLPADHPLPPRALRDPLAATAVLAPPTRLTGPSRSLETFELVEYHSRPPPGAAGADAHSETRARRREEKLQRLADEEEMKFSHSLQFNAVPDWSSHYLAYSNLKKLIYKLEKEVNQGHHGSAAAPDPESSPLLSGAADDPDQTFTFALDRELDKVCSFYKLKERETYRDLDELFTDERNFEQEHGELDVEASWLSAQTRAGSDRRGSVLDTLFGKRHQASYFGASGRDDEDSDDDANETSGLRDSRRSTGSGHDFHGQDGLHGSIERLSRTKTSLAHDDFSEQAMAAIHNLSITLKKRTINVYVSMCELRSFIQLNKTGFQKVLKKYDKIVDRQLKATYMERQVSQAYPFQSSAMRRLSENVEKIETMYSKLATHGHVPQAKRDLRLHLREHVVWERNTVWREMIGIERKAQAANLGLTSTMLGGSTDPHQARLQGDVDMSEAKVIKTPIGKYRCPRWLFSPTLYNLAFITAVFFLFLFIPIMDKPEEQNCLALIVFVSLLWATEAIPLFVTSLLVPFLVVVLRVVRADQAPHQRLDSAQAADYVFSAMWTPVIMLLLGGFTIAAALSKYNIAKMMATFVLSKAGTRPRTVLLTNMFVAMFASMWISNVAAPVLCYSIIQPILRNLPAGSSMTKALLLGIALASNIGGAASPIASPQNLIALQNMEPEPGWGVWFFVALPICIISALLIWILLLVTYQPGKDTNIVPIRPMKDPFSGVQWFISIVTLATIVLWCITHQLEPVFGDMGVVAIIPIALFFGTGILTKEDFNNFLWTIIILAAGGLALGKAVNSSGLLHTIAGGITARTEGMSLYGVLVVFATLILVVATFISHTVAALIVLPLVREVGQGMSQPHPNLLVMGSVLMCSAAMGLPTSGFPNMTAIMMEDPLTGRRYLRVKDFLTRGIASSVLTFSVVITLGYGLMLASGL